MSDDKIVHLKVVGPPPPRTDEDIKNETDALLETIKADGPFEFMLGVARRKDGTFMTFSTTVDIRDFVFSVEVMKMQQFAILADALDGEDEYDE